MRCTKVCPPVILQPERCSALPRHLSADVTAFRVKRKRANTSAACAAGIASHVWLAHHPFSVSECPLISWTTCLGGWRFVALFSLSPPHTTCTSAAAPATSQAPTCGRCTSQPTQLVAGPRLACHVCLVSKPIAAVLRRLHPTRPCPNKRRR